MTFPPAQDYHVITDCFERKLSNANVVELERLDLQVVKSNVLDRPKVGQINPCISTGIVFAPRRFQSIEKPGVASCL